MTKERIIDMSRFLWWIGADREECPRCHRKARLSIANRVPDLWTHPNSGFWRKRVCDRCFAKLEWADGRTVARDEAWEKAHEHRARPVYLGKGKTGEKRWTCPDCGSIVEEIINLSISQVKSFHRRGIEMPFSGVCPKCYDRAMATIRKR